MSTGRNGRRDMMEVAAMDELEEGVTAVPVALEAKISAALTRVLGRVEVGMRRMRHGTRNSSESQGLEGVGGDKVGSSTSIAKTHVMISLRPQVAGWPLRLHLQGFSLMKSWRMPFEMSGMLSISLAIRHHCCWVSQYGQLRRR